MADQVESLKDRYDELQQRKRSEAQGYQADINLLKQKIKQIEQQVVKTAVTKAKGKQTNGQDFFAKDPFLITHVQFPFRT